MTMIDKPKTLATGLLMWCLMCIVLAFGSIGLALKWSIKGEIERGNTQQQKQEDEIIANQRKIIDRLNQLESVQVKHGRSIEKNSEILKEINPESE